MEEVLPIQQIRLGLFRQQLLQLSNSITLGDYYQAISDASAAIDQVFQSQLLVLLDIRAHAHAKRGQYDAACADAQDMIYYAPELGAGYVRKGTVYSMYGQQAKAINAFNQGLGTVKSDKERLTMGLNNATMISKKRIDFLQQLPAELANHIIMLLPKDAKAACLTVSTVWAKRVMECQGAWHDLSVDDTPEDTELIHAAPSIVPYINHLTINASREAIRSTYMQCIKDAPSVRLQTLKMTASGTRNLRTDIITVSLALWQARHTLTRLEIDLGGNSNPVTMAETLVLCDSVTELTYSTTFTMSVVTGNFAKLKKQHPLASLELTTKSTTGRDIISMLQKCQQIRRLVMNGCMDTVLEPITAYTPNLEIFGYNTGVPIPPLEDTRGVPGLREIYTSNGGEPVYAPSLLPLLYRNRKTLERVCANMSPLSEPERQQMNTTFADFTLPNISELTFWCYSGIQPFILQSIRSTMTLTSLAVVNSYDLDPVIRAIAKLPPLTLLQISHITTTTNRSLLIQLCSRYARASKTRPALNTIIFRHCDEVTDDVIAALAEIKTLQNVTFGGLDHITTGGIIHFIQLSGQQLTDIRLDGMDSVTDSIVIALGDCENLSSIKLGNLVNVTDYGLRGLVLKRSHTLSTVVLKNCPLISAECISYCTKRLKQMILE
ncbi:hypothetical protein BJV82DRAFT_694330 [Fennellomyces sp. T-0311]|nr:hypothetical protein BJV82DRAFT_694330 [Fennellomyces sp. T-0311]